LIEMGLVCMGDLTANLSGVSGGGYDYTSLNTGLGIDQSKT